MQVDLELWLKIEECSKLPDDEDRGRRLHTAPVDVAIDGTKICVSGCLLVGEFVSGWLVIAITVAEPVETWCFCSMLLKTEEKLGDWFVPVVLASKGLRVQFPQMSLFLMNNFNTRVSASSGRLSPLLEPPTHFLNPMMYSSKVSAPA